MNGAAASEVAPHGAQLHRILELAGRTAQLQHEACRLDLARREPAAIDRLQTEIAERERRPAPRGAASPALHHLAVLDLLRCEHVPSRSGADRRALLLLLFRQHLATENPRLHADDA